MIARGAGWIADVPDARDYDAATLLRASPLAASPPPSSVALEHCLPPVRDQGTTGSCVGQAVAAQIETRAAAAGLVIASVSALGVYGVARRNEPDPTLDQGCRPRDAYSGIASHGVVSESRWPQTDDRARQRLPLDVWQHGADSLVAGYYRISEAGLQRLPVIRAALAAGLPVAYGQQLDDAWMQYGGGVLPDYTQAPTHGGHMTLLWGYDESGVFYGLNSWGTGWGMGGLYQISPTRLASIWCSDFWVMTLRGDSLAVS